MKRFSFNDAKKLDLLTLYFSREKKHGEPDLSEYFGVLAHCYILEKMAMDAGLIAEMSFGPQIIEHLERLNE
jgi:hypothetical protein